jgi:hypothetical protein
MHRQSRFSLVLMFMGVAALTALTGLRADNPRPKENTGKADKARAENSSAAAVKPKPLTTSVEKALAYLAGQQQSSGGWGQGGGWRNDLQSGGRIEGANVADPADVANTCIATLALVRAGHTPREGKYADNILRAVDFICKNIEKADSKSLYVTDIRGSQVQGKIGPFVDTFLASLVLAELKGRMPDEKSEKRLVAALNKTIGKIEDNQKADGTFAGNTGWASVFSQGLASKGLNRASQAGSMVQPESLARAEKQAKETFDAKSGTFLAAKAMPSTPLGGAGGFAGGTGSGRTELGAAGLGGSRAPAATAGPALSAGAGSAPTDAGVPIYTAGNSVAGLQEAVNTNGMQKEKARKTLARKDASKVDKERAQADLKRYDDVEKTCEQATLALIKRLKDQQFIQGFGSNGGEEFLSYMNISEALVAKGGKDWEAWDKAMADNLTRIQDKDGNWSGHHCITGKTFCTATALLVLMADRAPVPVAAKVKGGR